MRHVGLDRERAGAALFESLHCVRVGGGAAAHDDQHCAGLGKTFRDPETDAGISAGHDGDTPGQVEQFHASTPVSMPGSHADMAVENFSVA